jgi:hypothetical protein
MGIKIFHPPVRAVYHFLGKDYEANERVETTVMIRRPHIEQFRKLLIASGMWFKIPREYSIVRGYSANQLSIDKMEAKYIEISSSAENYYKFCMAFSEAISGGTLV